MDKNKFYVTTPIFYTNGRPHLGHVFVMTLADMFARYHRLRGEETFFLTGTDDNGNTVVQTARKQEITPKEWSDRNAAVFKQAAEEFGVSYSYFIRTSDPEKHWPTAQEIWKRLEEAGDIYKKAYTGLYCVGHEAFVTEKELDEDGLCPDHGTKPEEIEEENYFFKLSKYSDEIKKCIESGEFVVSPDERKNEVLEFISGGLEDVSFSRPSEKLDGWGIPVPGDDSHLMYVWADALTNYLSGIDYFSDNEKAEFWPADMHIIGKDILRFHAVIWPGMLLAANIPLPREVFVHGMITSGGYKMSKTRGNVVDPFEYKEKYGLEPLRYFLAAAIPTTQDGDFTHEQFVRKYNGDLASGLGNATARILALAEGVDFSGIEARPSELDEAERFKNAWVNYGEAFDNRDLRAAIGEVWELIHWVDGYIEKTKPWESKDPLVLYTLCVALANISWLLRPFLPDTAEKIAKGLGITGKATWDFEPKKIDPLFPKIEE